MFHYVKYLFFLGAFSAISIGAEDQNVVIPRINQSVITPQVNIERLVAVLESTVRNPFDAKAFVDLLQEVVIIIDAEYVFSNADKRLAVIAVLNAFIDETDTPYLPDSLFDPLFKSMLPSIVKLILPDIADSKSENAIFGPLPQMAVEDSVNKIIAAFGESIDIFKFADYLDAIVTQANKYVDLKESDKLSFAQEALILLVEKTNTESLPDFIVDPFLEQVGFWALEQVIN